MLGATGEDGQDVRDLAFIKLDGRGIGAQLEKLQSIDHYMALSAALREAFELRDLARFGVPENRYQIPIAGGDDLLIVVPAQWRSEKGAGGAFTLCKDLLEHVEGAFDRAAFAAPFANGAKLGDDLRKLGAGAGLVVTSGMPASSCFKYTDDLVKSAKDAVGDADCSALDFAVLRGGTPLATSLGKLRVRDPLEIDLGGDLEGEVRRSRCPYSLPGLRMLLERAALLARTPRSALHALHAAMREPTTGLLAIRYQLCRHPELRRALTGGEPLANLPPELGEWVLARPRDRERGRAPLGHRHRRPPRRHALRHRSAPCRGGQPMTRRARILVHLEGPLLVGGYASATGRLDATTATDEKRTPIVPASTLKGALREACTRLARIDGDDKACTIDQPCKGECLVCQLFGGPGMDAEEVLAAGRVLPGRLGGLFLGDARPETDGEAEILRRSLRTRHGVGIDCGRAPPSRRSSTSARCSTRPGAGSSRPSVPRACATTPGTLHACAASGRRHRQQPLPRPRPRPARARRSDGRRRCPPRLPESALLCTAGP